MPAATAAERHAARARSTGRGATLPRRISGPIARPRALPVPPRPVTGVFDRIKALPDHRVIDRLLRGRVWICFIGVALMAYGYFVTNAWVSLAIGSVLTLALFFPR